MTSYSSNSPVMVDDLMNLLCSLLDSLENQDWFTFERMALSSSSTFRALSRSISDYEEFNGMTLLHAIVRHSPPIKLLSKMIKLFPEALNAKDCLGRMPLHVAAGSGSDVRVMKLLVIASPQACNEQDEDGRTPLHFACDSSCELFEDDEDNPRGPPEYDVVRTLLAGSQGAVTLEDIDDMNALEYAICSDAPEEVVRLLQKVTQKQAKKKRFPNPPPGSPSNVMEAEGISLAAS